MTYNPHLHHRRSIRLRGWDYRTPGAYFVNICTHNRELLFGEITRHEMQLNNLGRAVEREWLRSAEIRAEIELDSFIVMPNHFHGIVWIVREPPAGPTVGAQGLAPLHPTVAPMFRTKPRSLGAMIRGFKSAAKIEVNRLRGMPGAPVWQRDCYERIIRNERELEAARKYILDNPAKWTETRTIQRARRRCVGPYALRTAT